MLVRLNAGERFWAYIPTTVTHHWDGSQPGAEDIENHHHVEIWREDTPQGREFRISACELYWELIPNGSPGAIPDYWYTKHLSPWA